MAQRGKGVGSKPKTFSGGFQLTPLPKYYSASRELRNQAEKQRRDKLNYHVSELASLVPFVSTAQKKIDKTSVLRLAASYLRMHQILRGSNSEEKIPLSIMNSDTSTPLFNAIGGFLLVVSNTGKIIFVSEAIEETFGYTQVDILGQSIYSLIHQDDRKLVENQLNPHEASESSRVSFYCRLLEKSISRNYPDRYEIIHVTGQLKALPTYQSSEKSGAETARVSLRRRSSSSASNISDADEECSLLGSPEPYSTRTGTQMLVALVQVVKDKPITDLTWVESMRDEYITRHRMDGNICYVDHRISIVTGMMPAEVRGSSAFNYMHKDDVLWSIIAQRQMFQSSQGQGAVTYRLKCKDGSFVSLRSRGFLEVNKTTGEVDSFVCINTLLRDCDAEKEVQEQRKSLLPLLDSTSNDLIQSFTNDLPPTLSSLVQYLLTEETLKQMVTDVNNGSIECDVPESMETSVKIVEIKDEPLDVASGVVRKTPKSLNPQHRKYFKSKASYPSKKLSRSRKQNSSNVVENVDLSLTLSSNKECLSSPGSFSPPINVNIESDFATSLLQRMGGCPVSPEPPPSNLNPFSQDQCPPSIYESDNLSSSPSLCDTEPNFNPELLRSIASCSSEAQYIGSFAEHHQSPQAQSHSICHDSSPEEFSSLRSCNKDYMESSGSYASGSYASSQSNFSDSHLHQLKGGRRRSKS